MRTYLLVSTVFFGILATAQLIRLALGWPVVVAGFSVPVWASGIAVLLLGSMAAWGTRTLFKTRVPTTGV